MAGKFSFAPKSDHIERNEYQCCHCEEWLTPNGKPPTDKVRSVKKVYCKYCDTADKRRAMDQENNQIKK